jgi:poly(3-hydroxyalkanoate) synthetase
VDLHTIERPGLTIAATSDTIGPLLAAWALDDCVGSEDCDTAVVPGGYVKAMAGSRARAVLDPKIGEH